MNKQIAYAFKLKEIACTLLVQNEEILLTNEENEETFRGFLIRRLLKKVIKK